MSIGIDLDPLGRGGEFDSFERAILGDSAGSEGDRHDRQRRQCRGEPHRTPPLSETTVGSHDAFCRLHCHVTRRRQTRAYRITSDVALGIPDRAS
jgi:hypothetical protein